MMLLMRKTSHFIFIFYEQQLEASLEQYFNFEQDNG